MGGGYACVVRACVVDVRRWKEGEHVCVGRATKSGSGRRGWVGDGSTPARHQAVAFGIRVRQVASLAGRMCGRRRRSGERAGICTAEPYAPVDEHGHLLHAFEGDGRTGMPDHDHVLDERLVLARDLIVDEKRDQHLPDPVGAHVGEREARVLWPLATACSALLVPRVSSVPVLRNAQARKREIPTYY